MSCVNAITFAVDPRHGVGRVAHSHSPTQLERYWASARKSHYGRRTGSLKALS